MGFLKKYIKKYWKPFCIAVSFLMLEVICDLMQPTIMSKIIDVGIAGRDIKYVLSMGAIMLGVTTLGALGAISRNIVSSNVSQKFGMDMRSDLFSKIQTLSFDNIGKFETASLVTRLTNDIIQVQNFAHGLMRIFVKAPLLFIGSIIMASLLNPGMTLIIVAIVPAVSFLIYMSMKIGSPFFSKVQKALDKVNGVMREYLAGVRVVKAFNRFDYEKGRFAGTNKDLAEVSITAMRVMAVFTPGISLVVNMGIIAVLWIGGRKVNNGSMHVGQVIAFVNYMTQILFSVMMISWIFTTFVRAKVSAERIGEVMAQENSMIVSAVLIDPIHKSGQVDFEQVSFTYAGTSQDLVLKDITFTCLPGETVGIIGSTGSGKTTLVNLLSRFYDVTSGRIRMDGIDIRDIDPKVLRDRIAVVSQKVILFTGTILENIKWGKENATLDEIKKVADVAQAHEFISSFPEGYETLLGQRGVNLSGGQKQRISIARALVHKPEIMIFDDCTSAVDVATEAKIREALKSYANDLTCLIIAQRITSVMDADRIVVLDEGQMVGTGTHEELMQTCTVYRDIYHSQIGKEGI